MIFFSPPILPYSRLLILSDSFSGALENNSFHILVKCRFHELLEEGKVYEVFGGRVQKIDPKTYKSSVKNDFEIIADALTSFEEQEEAPPLLPYICLAPTKIDKITKTMVHAYIG
jgi:hypothetical protein